MFRHFCRRRWSAACLAIAGAVACSSLSFAFPPPKVAPPPGLRENTPTVHALVNAKIVVAPGRVIDKGTLVLRDGVITAVGADVQAPSDARVWDMTGKTLYPGLIDAYTELGASGVASGGSGRGSSGPPASAAGGTPAYWNSNVAPQTRADMLYAVDKDANKRFRTQGVAVRLVAAASGIIKGTSAVVASGDSDSTQSVLAEQAALHLKLANSGGGERGSYPNSPMGAVALVRQALLDSEWYRQVWQAYRHEAGLARPEISEALEVLQAYPHSKSPVVIDSSNELYFLRADALGKEFDLNVIVRGSGYEYRRLDAVKDAGRAVIVPLNFPAAPNVKTPEAVMNTTLGTLMHWDIGPENPARLAKAGVRIAFTSAGLRDSSKFLDAVRTAVRRGLPAEEALRALTVTPAELFGVAGKCGTLEIGKAGHVVVADGDLFDKKTKLPETWVDGQRYENSPPPANDIRGAWEVALLDPAGKPDTAVVQIAGELGKFSGKLVHGDKEAKFTSVSLSDSQLSASFKGNALGWDGVVQLSAVISLDAKAGDTFLGNVLWPEGAQAPVGAKRTSNKFVADAKDSKADDSNADDATKPGDKGDQPVKVVDKPANEKPSDAKIVEGKSAEAKTAQEKPEDEKTAGGPRNRSGKGDDKPALFAVNYPLGPFGRDSELPPQPKAVLFKNATVWTCGPQGLVAGASVLVENGKIVAVGKDLRAPAECVEIDCAGKHLTPGIIDCHSHSATDGGINESGQTITAEVRIGDFVNCNDVDIYRQLAGGVTTANILHGSANTIGGQNQVVKYRWGAGPEQMKFAGAVPGIKFALGENVKQSNWGEGSSSRYPQTRMGVEQLVLDAFRSARHYQQTWAKWRQDKQGLPPHVDLELEALGEVLDGKRLIHCHSYRQDEILAFLRTCSAFGVRVATLQHVLEGYKLADLMAEQGVGGSTFSDWWAYKFEVYDAIPYNGALMHNAGVTVSFNSDDAMARRLNTEAAKAVKYGQVPETEALKFVTLNPAKQLRIDRHVGSLEAGKDADLALWSGSPLSTYSLCEQTWIDGRKYFDRSEDLAQRGEAVKRKAALVQRVLASGESEETTTTKTTAIGRRGPAE